MCKVSCVTKVSDKNRDEVWAFMQILGEYMTYGNDHGLGYAALDSKLNLFGERWLVNDHAFRDLSHVSGLTAEKMNNLYSYFGNKVVRDDARAILLHTRYATCARSITNTHPFVDDEDDPKVAIIHNGVISNHKEFTSKYSTCDSEVLAHLYAENEVGQSLSNLNEFTTQLEGWYTVLNLTKDGQGTPIIDMYSQNGRLCSFFIPELDTRVYASSRVDIEATAKFLGMTCTNGQVAEEYHAYRVNAVSGEVMGKFKFAKPQPKNVKYAEGNFDDDSLWQNWWTQRGGGVDV